MDNKHSGKRPFENYMNGDKLQTFNLVQRHFASNIDFTGDCHSDLVILSKANGNSILEFYERSTNSGFKIIDNV